MALAGRVGIHIVSKLQEVALLYVWQACKSLQWDRTVIVQICCWLIITVGLVLFDWYRCY
jgi:hypothetical protein